MQRVWPWGVSALTRGDQLAVVKRSAAWRYAISYAAVSTWRPETGRRCAPELLNRDDCIILLEN